MFPYVNKPGGTHELPAGTLAEVVGHSSDTREYRLTPAQLTQGIANWRPAVQTAGAGESVSIFVDDVDNLPPAACADTMLRQQF